MKNKLLICSILFFVIVFGYYISSNATISSQSKQVNSGEQFSLTVTSNIALGSYSIKAENYSGLTFVTSSAPAGAAGIGETTISNALSSGGTTTLATFTFKAPTVTKDSTYTIKFSATGMGDEKLAPVADSSTTVTITVKAPATEPTTPSEPETPSESETPKELEFTKVNETVYVEKTVNLRASYSSSSKLIKKMEVGEALTRIGKSIGTAEGYSWSKILYNGQEVYAISRNLTTEKPETTEEPVEENPDEEQPAEETPAEETPAEETPTEEVPTDVFGLSKLEIKNQTLSPKFDVETYEYTIGLKEDISSLEIEAVANNENANVEIIGNENLKDGENVITILVTNAETEEVATYQIIVNKNTQTEGVAKVNWLQPSTWGTREKIIVGIIGALILVIIILIIVKIRLAKREDDDLDLPGADELDRALTEHQELTENEEMEAREQEEKSKTDIEKAQEYFEQYSKRRGKHF